jgi:hypothetical protein
MQQELSQGSSSNQQPTQWCTLVVQLCAAARND